MHMPAYYTTYSSRKRWLRDLIRPFLLGWSVAKLGKYAKLDDAKHLISKYRYFEPLTTLRPDVA